jgi:RNA-directed DNA polymerase
VGCGLSMNYSSEKIAWITKERLKIEGGPRQPARRRYIHFDPKLNKLTPAALQDVFSPEKVASHAFYPLIQEIQSKRRYTKDERGESFVKAKLRRISYAAHFDALIYSWYADVLSNLYEKELSKLNLQGSVTAYRSLKESNAHFALRAISFIRKQSSPISALCFDIEDFFGSLQHTLLKQRWCALLQSDQLPLDHYRIFSSVTRYSFVHKENLLHYLGITHKHLKHFSRYFKSPSVFRTFIKTNLQQHLEPHGIPQGLSLSAVLSNIYMLDFDSALMKFAQENSGYFSRYSDDIILILPKGLESIAAEHVRNTLSSLGLRLNGSKTEIKTFMPGQARCQDFHTQLPSSLQYLGIEYDGQRIYLRHRGLANFQRKAVRTIRASVGRSRKNGSRVSKRKLYRRFTALGPRNYLTYARKAAFVLGAGPTIGRQVGSRSKSVRWVKNLLQAQ